MPTLAGTALVNGLPQDGASVTAWLASRFGSPPAYDDTPPAGVADSGPVTSGSSFGGAGQYRMTVGTATDYYIEVSFGGHRAWQYANAGSGGGGGATGGGSFAQTANVVPSATSGVIGPAVVLTPDVGFGGILGVWAGGIVVTGLAGEGWQVHVTATFDNGTTATVDTPAYQTSTHETFTTYAFTTTDIQTLNATAHYITQFSVTMQTNTTASAATAAVSLFGVQGAAAIGSGSSLTYTYSYSGVLAVRVGDIRTYIDRSLTISKVRASVGQASTGASVIVDILKNGVTLYTTTGHRPTLTAGTNMVVAPLPDITALALDDYLTVSVAQIGSSFEGADLTVQVVAA